MRLLRSFIVTSAILAIASSAFAQSSKASAEALYREGQKLIADGKISEACARFAESQAQDPTEATLVALAACHEKQGKTATAWGEYTEASTKAGPAADFAKGRATALEPMLAKLHIDLSPIPDGLEVHVDQFVFRAGAIGTDIPIDPGAHVLSATATNKKPWSGNVAIDPKPGVVHVAIAFEDAPAPVTPAPATNPDSARTAPLDGPDYQRPISLGVAGAGLALLGVGAYYEVNAVSDRNKYDREKIHLINSRGDSWSDIASKAQVYAIVFGALGVAAVAAGAVLFFTDSSGHKVAITPFGASGTF